MKGGAMAEELLRLMVVRPPDASAASERVVLEEPEVLTTAGSTHELRFAEAVEILNTLGSEPGRLVSDLSQLPFARELRELRRRIVAGDGVDVAGSTRELLGRPAAHTRQRLGGDTSQGE
jgi:hypothetical protein